jgi:hypothetical protein
MNTGRREERHRIKEYGTEAGSGIETHKLYDSRNKETLFSLNGINGSVIVVVRPVSCDVRI